MKKYFNFKNLVIFSALIIASCAALFSITGFGRLFAGSMIPVMFLAGGLELGKLVGVSFLYRYWDEAPKALRTLMLTISLIVMCVTSAGIYGYLTAAYAKVAAVPLQQTAQVGILNSQIQTIDGEISNRTTRFNQIIAMRQQQENRIDTLISKGISARTAQSQIIQLNTTVNQLQKEISGLTSKRDSLKSQSITTDVGIKTNSDIGTFVYVAQALGVSLDTVVKWFVLIIVCVFDPLSVCLIIAYNFLVKRKEIVVEPPILTIYNEKENPNVPVTPQQEFVPEIPMIKREENEVDKLLDINSNGIPDWMEPNFNWDDVSKWQNNPIARLFKKYIVK